MRDDPAANSSAEHVAGATGDSTPGTLRTHVFLRAEFSGVAQPLLFLLSETARRGWSDGPRPSGWRRLRAKPILTSRESLYREPGLECVRHGSNSNPHSPAADAANKALFRIIVCLSVPCVARTRRTVAPPSALQQTIKSHRTLLGSLFLVGKERGTPFAQDGAYRSFVPSCSHRAACSRPPSTALLLAYSLACSLDPE